MAIKTFQKVETIRIDDTQTHVDLTMIPLACLALLFTVWGVGLVREWVNWRVLPFLVFGMGSFIVSIACIWVIVNCLFQSPEDYYKERRDNLIIKGYVLVETGK